MLYNLCRISMGWVQAQFQIYLVQFSLFPKKCDAQITGCDLLGTFERTLNLAKNFCKSWPCNHTTLQTAVKVSWLPSVQNAITKVLYPSLITRGIFEMMGFSSISIQTCLKIYSYILSNNFEVFCNGHLLGLILEILYTATDLFSLYCEVLLVSPLSFQPYQQGSIPRICVAANIVTLDYWNYGAITHPC